MIEIVPCKLRHLRSIAPRLREEERIELAALAVKPRHALHDLWRATPDPRAAIESAGVLAVWGDASSPLAAEGLVWILTSALIERMPLLFARTARTEIERMLISRETLRSSVHLSCHRALRFYRMLGFEMIEDTVREGFVEIRMSR